ncbi:MAG TPA: flagellin lysine-N-methylase [Syntrophomonadaceae bacterium]|nr:flagellin lysine-N-methylase [Syntrophomonadaceae bacterium]
MSHKKRPLLVPQYMRSFSCIGSNCEDSCCRGWRVDIDHTTYKRYQRVRDAELKPDLDQYIGRNRSQVTEDNYAKVRLNPDASCPFLNGERLCRIQLKMGENYLSDTCTTYPRITNIVNDVVEKSATMSCPEAARLALLNADRMEFDEIDEDVDTRNMIIKQLNTHKLAATNRPEQYFEELRTFTIQVLQYRSITLAERLTILGLFFQKAEKIVEEANVDEIPSLIASYTNLIESGALHEELAKIPVQVAIQMELLKELADERVVIGVNNQRYLECFAHSLHGLQFTEEATVEEIANRYQEAEKKYYRPFMEEREYIMENYLVNYVFKNLFPFSSEQNVFENYVMLVIRYALIKMHLIGMAAFHQGLTDDLAILLIQSFAKTVEHNKQYLQKIFGLLKQNGYTTMAYMAILIKN